MKFAELYKDNVSAVKRMLKSMWCRNATTDTQKSYIEQIEKLIDEELFASEQYMPLVQCMEQYPSLDLSKRMEVERTMKSLWEKAIFDPEDPDKYYTPYKHQWNAWESLYKTKADGVKQSMVVTTGTGSGKTECFMLPLIKDLTTDDIQHPVAKNHGVVEALFLYPLNALMEDQKERLHKLLKDTNLTFASYNGNLSRKYEDDPTTASQRKNNAQIDFERDKYCNTDGSHTIVATREELWGNPANILLTNPTMLEYMLLRNEDQCLFSPGSLKWIVIDEAHSYSGAGAAELAMLIRRVLQAFNIDDPNKIRFALSSATIGNEEDKAKKTEQLLDFISKLTGVDKENITTISADRVAKAISTNKDIERCRKVLIDNDYVKLDELFPSGTVMEKLSQLDAMCNDDGSVDVPLKAKVHFFYRVPNNGLRICLDDVSDSGAFKVKSFAPTDTKTPALELMRCEKCGEFFAVAEEVAGNRYCAHTKDDANLFDLSSRENNRILLFALTNKDKIEEGNQLFEVKEEVLTLSSKRDGYNLIANFRMRCPHCDTDLRIKKSDKKDNDGEDGGLITDDWQKVRTYRLSAEFISRTLAPSILPHLHKYTPKDGEDEKVILEKPHYGQQYISFVDSRQAAAKSTLKQNLVQESAWIYSRLMNKLSEQTLNRETEEQAWKNAVDTLSRIPRTDSIDNTIKEYQQKLAHPTHITWMESFRYLNGEYGSDIERESMRRESTMLCELFVNKLDSEEYNDKAEITPLVKSKYLLQAMLDNLGRHSKTEAGQETMGLFTSYYPKLQEVTTLPDAVEDFNKQFGVEIDITQWRNLIKIFLDYKVRSNESFEFSDQNYPDINIQKLRRFGSKKESYRKSISKSNVNDNNQNDVVVTLLATLISPDADNMGQIAKEHREYITPVLDALWKDIENTGIILYDNNSQGWYLNITNIAFKLYDEMYICNVANEGGTQVELRPVDILFMGYSPYIIDDKAVCPIDEVRSYAPYEYINGIKDGKCVTVEEIRMWSNDNRKILCDYGLWGESGYFTDRLDYIYSYPNLFVQAESTAQVDKVSARQNQLAFKQQDINIMACSTTMEMGVDLGNMELVLMQSVPPHPTNYKQRAGRSGRNKDTRSVAITLCDSGAAGLRTLLRPLEGLINRRMTVPTVDLKSRNVVRRHINATLLREFFKTHSIGDEILQGRVIDFFSVYKFKNRDESRDRNSVVLKPDGNIAFPNSGLGGDSEKTLYNQFTNWLLNGDVSGLVGKLINGTYYHNGYNVSDCIEDIERCYSELEEKFEYYKKAYEDAYEAEEARGNDNVRSDTGEVDTGYGRFLTRKYYEIFAEKLGPFFATHRMTPNATMPIAVVSFNHAPKLAWKNRFLLDKPNNPSYTLREALSQYAPGNTVVLENKAIVVAGVDYTGIDLNREAHRTFCTLYTDGSATTIDNDKILTQKRKWPINDKNELTMVRPIAYNADINALYTRHVDRNTFTCVSAQLVDADKWQESSNPKRMLDMRSNKEAGNGQILYTNIGLGKGYAFCAMCGKTVAETYAIKGNQPLPYGFNEEGKTYHYNIRRLKNGKPYKCDCKRMIYRNVVIGDTIQTDFCEIMIRKEVDGMWLNGQSEHKTLLTTIGLLISTTFADYLGKDRNDVDFVVMQNGHLCIYDTNPGGSGYSDQLADRNIMHKILKLCKERVDDIKSKDELIDKFSAKYLNDIDIEAARAWIDIALNKYDAVPEDITKKQPNAQISYIKSMINKIKQAQAGDVTLFVDSEFEKWISGDPAAKVLDDQNVSNSWRKRIFDTEINQFANADIVIGKTDWIPRPIFSTLHYIKGVAGSAKIQKITEQQLGEGLYPLVKVGNRLYFTDTKEYALLNYNWACGDIYYIDSLPNISTVDIDLTNIPENCKKFIVSKERLSKTTCRNLAAGVIDCGGDDVRLLIEEFKRHCQQNSNSGLNICYRDEYLRTPLAMITAIGFIDHFIKVLDIKPNRIEIIGEQFKPGKKDPNPNDSCDYSDMDLDTYFKWSNNRDNIFREICKAAWSYDVTVDSRWRNSLPHWRDLKLECAGKELIIYPNGGVFNGWELADDKDKLLDMNSIIDAVSDIQDFSLKRSNNASDKELMYDMELK